MSTLQKKKKPLTGSQIAQIRQAKIDDKVELVTPNKLHLLESKEDQFYWRKFKDYKIPVYEAEQYYVVIQEAVHFEAKGNRLSIPRIAKYSIDVWNDLTLATPQAKNKYGQKGSNTGLNPLMDLSIEIIHDPMIETKSEEKKKNPVEPIASVEFTLEDLEGKDDSEMKAIYKQVFGKGSGRMSAENVREKLVEELGKD